MLNIIAAIAADGAIGKNNDLPWYFPEDLKRFKLLTKGHPLIMGWLTLLSILTRNGKPLAGRPHFVLTSKSALERERIFGQLVKTKFPEFDVGQLSTEVFFCKTFGNAVMRAEAIDPEVFVIGGRRVFEEAVLHAQRMYITHIHHKYFGCDVYFPDYDKSHWSEFLHDRVDFPDLSYMTLNKRTNGSTPSLIT